MISLLLGENSYLRDIELAKFKEGAAPSVYDGQVLTIEKFIEITIAQSFFFDTTKIIIKDLSGNKIIWENVVDLLAKTDDAKQIMLVESKIDKRTSIYKSLQKLAKVIDCDFLGDRQIHQAEQWLKQLAASKNLKLSGNQVSQLVKRAIRQSDSGERKMIIDQQRLATIIEQLCGIETVTDDMIEAVSAPAIQENVFELLDLALFAKTDQLLASIANLKQYQDGHLVAALLITQICNLVILKSGAKRDTKQIAADFSIHPFVLSNLHKHLGSTSESQLSELVSKAVTTDKNIKTGVDAWEAVVVLLSSIAATQKKNATN